MYKGKVEPEGRVPWQDYAVPGGSQAAPVVTAIEPLGPLLRHKQLQQLLLTIRGTGVYKHCSPLLILLWGTAVPAVIEMHLFPMSLLI
jgi:hypothetical protein